MRFYTRMPVQKAKRKRAPWKRTRTYNRLTKLSTAMAQSVRADLVGGIQKFKKNVSGERIYQAWLSGDWNKVYASIPWENLPVHMEKGLASLDKTVWNSADLIAESLPAPVKSGLRWDTRNPVLSDFVAKRTAQNVVNIQSDSQKIIQNAVMRHFDEALGPDRVADLIKGSIGLYPQQETALRNYKAMLEKQEMTPSRIEKLGDAYETRLLDYRAMMIARTETRMAANEGQLAVWQTAANDDLIDRNTAKKVWIVDGNPCEICDPMDGVGVLLDGGWSLNNGDYVENPTESHPNCMCGMELDFGDSRDRLENSEPADYNDE